MEQMPAENITFTLTHTDNTPRYFHYYVESPEGETGDRTYGGKNYDLYTDLRNDFNIVYYNDDFWKLRGFTRQVITKSNNQTVGRLSGAGDNCHWNDLNSLYGGVDNHLYFYYTRDKYPINYMDGIYINGNGVELEVANRGQLAVSGDIGYGSDISSYNKGGDHYYSPSYQGYTFAGWYIDEKCTQPYTFHTMPLDGVTVYAKWVQTQYRVFMHPNVESSDTSLQWGNQSMCFRVNYDGKISRVNGTRDEYELIGWYSDEALTKPYNFDAFVLNDDNVTAPYAQDPQTESTERDKYGNPTEYTNADANGNHFWITKKLDLYAKWRAKLNGAKGIDVVYDANGGTNAPEDPLQYLDNSEAVAGMSSAPADSENEQFLYWVVQAWDETTRSYQDTAVKVYPGNSFTVYKANARKTDNPDTTGADDKYLYTVQVRAEYGPKDTPKPTHITWYDNFTENPVSPANYITDADQPINQAVNIEPATRFTRPGYKFLGWARVPTTDSNGNPLDGYTLEPRDLTADDLYLTYDGDTGTFTAVGSDNQTHTVTQVAADGDYPYHDMYAVWERSVFNVVVKKTIAGEYADTTKLFTFTPSAALSSGGSFQLTDGGEQTFSDIDSGTKISVDEDEAGYTSAIIVHKYATYENGEYKDEAGSPVTIQDGAEITVDNHTVIEYTNSYPKIVITGIRSGDPLYVLPLMILILSLTLLAYMYVRYRRWRRMT